jgi:hypothetical protein
VAGLGIGGFLVLLVLSWATGTNLFTLLGTGDGAPSQNVGTSGEVQASPAEERMVDFVNAVSKDAQSTWAELLGPRYERTRVVLFRGAIDSACGFAHGRPPGQTDIGIVRHQTAVGLEHDALRQPDWQVAQLCAVARAEQAVRALETAEPDSLAILRDQLVHLRRRSLALDAAVILAAGGGAATCMTVLLVFVGAFGDGSIGPVL